MLRLIGSRTTYKQAAAAIWQPGREAADGSLDVRDLIRCATLAASSHNTQPWKFAADSSIIRIQPDYARRCPAVDPDDSHLFKSLGCAAENLVHAAAAQGHRAHVRFEPSQDAIVIQLERTSSARPSRLSHAIPSRQCVRTAYNGQPLSAAQAATLDRESVEGDVHPMLLSSSEQMETIVELVQEGNRVQFRDRAFVTELQQWIRYNPQEAIRTGDGLAGVVMGRPPLPSRLGHALFGLLASGGRQAAVDARHIRSSAGVVLFVGETDSRASWINAGRAFERFALRAATWGIRAAFINQPIEVRSLRPQLRSWLQVSGQHVHLMARFGEGPSVPHSLRRPVEAVLLSS